MKTNGTIRFSRQQKNIISLLIRNYSHKQIGLELHISDNTVADRVSMGIKPRDKTRTKNPVPATIPIIVLKAGAASAVNVFFRFVPEGQTDSKKGKPLGIGSCEIAWKLGDTAPTIAADCPNKTSGTRNPIPLSFSGADAGKRIYVFARWLNTTDQPGPWTVNVMSMLVPG